jgi:hypothetical protein
MGKNYQGCNFLYPDVMEACKYPFYLRILAKIQPYVFYVFTKINPNEYIKKDVGVSQGEELDLQPGEWVQVRSLDEIFATLDKSRKYKGLYFMPEMEKFCNKKYKVFKKVEKIKLESTGEIRKLKSPTVFLEGLHCDGSLLRHCGCDRACFHFWKEVWLKRVEDF